MIQLMFCESNKYWWRSYQFQKKFEKEYSFLAAKRVLVLPHSSVTNRPLISPF